MNWKIPVAFLLGLYIGGYIIANTWEKSAIYNDLGTKESGEFRWKLCND